MNDNYVPQFQRAYRNDLFDITIAPVDGSNCSLSYHAIGFESIHNLRGGKQVKIAFVENDVSYPELEMIPMIREYNLRVDQLNEAARPVFTRHDSKITWVESRFEISYDARGIARRVITFEVV